MGFHGKSQVIASKHQYPAYASIMVSSPQHTRMNIASYFAESAKILDLARQAWSDDLLAGAVGACTTALRNGRPVLVCGNGGSAADAMHFTAELVGRFLIRRQAFNVICLS